MKNIKIKICGVKNTSTLDCCNHCNIDYFGLIFFNKSPRNISINQPLNLISYTKNLKPIPVGVFVNHNIDNLSEIIKKINLQNIQLSGNENNEYITKLKDRHNVNIIKAISIKEGKDLDKTELYSNTDFFLFDYKPTNNELPGGNAKSFNWSLLKKANITKPWFIAGGINKNNIKYILENLIPYGIDISSGVEDYPGIKSSKKINEIVKIIHG